MQIVINISEKMYESVMDGTYCGTLYQELKNGTPLPKGHGRLIDASKIDCRNGAWTFAEAIEYASTIVKADEVET